MPYMRPNYAGTALPAISETVTLFNTNPSTTAVPSNYFAGACVTRYSLDLKNDQAGTLTLEKSKDGGTNWVTIYSIAVAAAASTATNHYEFPVAGFQDLRVKFANGGTAQGTFVVDQELDDLPINPGAAGLAGAGAAIAAADAMANPTEDGVLGYNLGFNGTTWDRVRTGIELKQADGVGIMNTLPMGVYDLTPDTLTDHDIQNLQLDINGGLRSAEQYAAVGEDNTNGVFAVAIKPLAATTYAPSTFSSVGAATTATPKASAGNLFSISATNRNGAARYLQIYNTTAATTPVLYQFVIPPGSTIIVGTDFWTTAGFNFSTGITWGVSTTAGSYVAATASETDVFGAYI